MQHASDTSAASAQSVNCRCGRVAQGTHGQPPGIRHEPDSPAGRPGRTRWLPKRQNGWLVAKHFIPLAQSRGGISSHDAEMTNG